MVSRRDEYRTISVIGDSIANGYFDKGNLGWVTRLGQKLQQDKPGRIYIRNAAVSGDCTTDCLARLRSQVVSNPGDCLIIACGVNDLSRWGGRDASTSLSGEFCKEIWTYLLQEARYLCALVYVCQILPVDESEVPYRQNDLGFDHYYRNDDIDAYNAQIKKLSEQFGCPYIEFTDMLKGRDWNDYLFDEVHPNHEGHEFIAQTVYSFVKDDVLGLFDL